LSVKALGGELLPLQAPLKPGGELSVAPGAIVALYDRLVIVTVAPLCVKVPFHNCVTVCPLGKANTRFQPLIVVVPVLVIVILTPKPPGHWLVTVYCTRQLAPLGVGVGVGVLVGVGVGVGVCVGVGVGVGVDVVVGVGVGEPEDGGNRISTSAIAMAISACAQKRW
jgi:hypothetical protein